MTVTCRTRTSCEENAKECDSSVVKIHDFVDLEASIAGFADDLLATLA